MHAHAKVPKTMKDKFFYIKDWFGMNPTSSGSRSKPLFSDYKKSYMVPFQRTQNSEEKYTRFTRNSELKREFFTEHPQVNIFLIETYSGLDL